MNSRKSAWKTENWTCIGGEIFMIQQRWELWREYEYKTSRNGPAVGMSLESFPTDEWRIMSMHEMMTDADLQKLVDAQERVNES